MHYYKCGAKIVIYNEVFLQKLFIECYKKQNTDRPTKAKCNNYIVNFILTAQHFYILLIHCRILS